MTDADLRGIGAVYVLWRQNIAAALEALPDRPGQYRQAYNLGTEMTRRQTPPHLWRTFRQRMTSDHPLTDESRSVRKAMASDRS